MRNEELCLLPTSFINAFRKIRTIDRDYEVWQ